MSRGSQSPETIFEQALEIETPLDRSAFLDRACGGDTELRRQIGALVNDHFAAGEFLQRPAADFAATVDGPADLEAGAVIGRYKLLQEIGQGGFGVVFMAEQLEPVRRRVALKIIKLGMDTKQVIGRFEAER